MSSTQKTEKKTTFNYPHYLATFIEKYGDTTGPPVCEKCEVTYSRDKWGWFCYLCKDEESSLLWKEVPEGKKKRITNNDRFYDFMQMKNKARNE